MESDIRIIKKYTSVLPPVVMYVMVSAFDIYAAYIVIEHYVIINFNVPACPDRIANIAAALGENVLGLEKAKAAQKAASVIRKLGKAVGLPTTLSEYGADKALIPICAKYAETAGDMPGNPITPTLEQIEDLYKQAFEGNRNDRQTI